MNGEDRPRSVGLSLVCLLAIAGTLVMVALDAYDWFYHQTRRHEAMDLDEIVTFMSLFMIVGLLVLSLRQRRWAMSELARRIETDVALERLNSQLEHRIKQRTSELEAELEERRGAERKLDTSQRQLQRLSAELADAADRQRRRIAADLHDNLGHTLAMARNQLSLLRASGARELDAGILDEISDRVGQAIRYSRTLVSDLSQLSDLLPFDSAIRWLVEDVLRDLQIAVSVDVRGEPELPPGNLRAIFTLALREILVNIVKHARARSVQISVRTEDDWIVVYVADDGVGFDIWAAFPSGSAKGLGYGLHTVADRLETLGGTASVQSRPGRGTWVCLKAPLPAREGVDRDDRDRARRRPPDLPAGPPHHARTAG